MFGTTTAKRSWAWWPEMLGLKICNNPFARAPWGAPYLDGVLTCWPLTARNPPLTAHSAALPCTSRTAPSCGSRHTPMHLKKRLSATAPTAVGTSPEMLGGETQKVTSTSPHVMTMSSSWPDTALGPSTLNQSW